VPFVVICKSWGHGDPAQDLAVINGFSAGGCSGPVGE
jgi:hypothetical protein